MTELSQIGWRTSGPSHAPAVDVSCAPWAARPGGGPMRVSGSSRWTRSSRRQLSIGWIARIAVVVLVGAFLPAMAFPKAPAQAATTCPAGGCAVTVDARDFGSGTPLASFNFIVNKDNTKLPSDPLALSTESNSPIVAVGGNSHPTVHVPDGRYLISARALDHKMWGVYVTVPDPATADGSLTARIDLTEQSEAHPLPLGKIRVFVFNDNAWTNGAPDTEETSLQGFKIGLEEQTGSAVTVDYNNNPLCGGECLTATNGLVTVNDLGPATYFIDVHPPDTPCNSTAYWFGFVCAPQPFATSGTGEVVGTARNWVEWAPYTMGTVNDPVE